MRFILLENFLEDSFNKIVKTELNTLNSWLDKYGFEVEIIDEDVDDYVEGGAGVFLGSLQDNASIFPIALNKDLIIGFAKENSYDEFTEIQEITYGVRGTLWHEAGHGIFGFLYDIYDLDDMDEEEIVEEFAIYREDSELYDILKNYLEDYEN